MVRIKYFGNNHENQNPDSTSYFKMRVLSEFSHLVRLEDENKFWELVGILLHSRRNGKMRLQWCSRDFVK